MTSDADSDWQEEVKSAGKGKHVSKYGRLYKHTFAGFFLLIFTLKDMV